jgi:uncharacterized protein (DUF849 family)
LADRVLIKACLNGSRVAGAHPALPLTAAELARAAVAAVNAGAGAVHIHPRRADGSQSHAASEVGEAVAAIKAAVPGLPVGVTTGFWIARDLEKRLQEVRAWQVLPDFASVNWFEDGPEELAELLLAMGVGVEAGLASVENAEAFAASRVASRCLRALVEVRAQDGERGVELTSAMDAVLERAGLTLPRLHHGFNQYTWGIIGAGFDKGRDVRVGLEDTLVLPDGREPRDNAELVAAAVVMARRRGLEPLQF